MSGFLSGRSCVEWHYGQKRLYKRQRQVLVNVGGCKFFGPCEKVAEEENRNVGNWMKKKD